MKKFIITLVIPAMMFCSFTNNDIMSKGKDGTYIINTTTICDAKGFKDKTPVLVYVKKDKIVRIEAIDNIESPSFFQKVKKNLLPLYEGKNIKEAKELTNQHIEGCTGATYSTNAVQKNINSALDYYKSNK